MTLLLTLLRNENEDNAVLCMKVIIDLHRSYSRPFNPASTTALAGISDPPKSAMELSVDEFLRIVSELFKGMGDVVEETFSSNVNTPGETAPSPAGTMGGVASLEESGASVLLPPAMKSFKLLQECPAAIVFIFQTYRPMVETAITIFVPLVFDVSSLTQGETDPDD